MLYRKGTYTVINKLITGEEFSHKIEIVEGLRTEKLAPQVCITNSYADLQNAIELKEDTVFGDSSLTELRIAVGSNDAISHSTGSDIDKYGISNKTVGLMLRLKYDKNLNNQSWKIDEENYGKYTGQSVMGLGTGSIGTGVLIIRKKSNINDPWKMLDKGSYAGGLFATDYQDNFGNQGDVMIYIPNGQDVIKGEYLDILYCYSVKQEQTGEVKSYIERYTFYLSNANLGSVVFHNLSVVNKEDELINKDDYTISSMKILQDAETLTDNSFTTTGFEIDTSKIPNVTINIKRNGEAYTLPYNNKVSGSGKYEIEMTSNSGTKMKKTIYVDKSSFEDMKTYYFGESFITGKRIYDKNSLYPVFEVGAKYNIAEIDDFHSPVSGIIYNLDNPDVSYRIEAGKSFRNGRITESGTYEAVFSNNQTIESGNESGDVITFTFHFVIRDEHPGPRINKENLEEYKHMSIWEAPAKCYYVTMKCANQKNISILFSSKEAAIAYAYNLEKEKVEIDSQGKYYYSGNINEVKINYDLDSSLTKDIDTFARENVKEIYFDRTEEINFYTLSDEVIRKYKNLRELSLSNSVYIFNDDTERLVLTNTDTLPIINDKRFYYINPAQELSEESDKKEMEDGTTGFEFVKDPYGCDSDRIEIIDCNGKKYEIEYDLKVGEQLNDKNCPSGEITIVEYDVYGDKSEYKALFFKENDNTTELKLRNYINNEIQELTFTQENYYRASIKSNGFIIESATDKLDPYSIVIVEKDKERKAFLLNEIDDEKCSWDLPGTYLIKVINRMGFSYSFKIVIEDSEAAIISFSQSSEDEKLTEIITYYGATSVKLPKLEKYGFDFTGYVDEEGTEYTDEISKIMFKGMKLLQPIWTPKTINLTLKYNDNSDDIKGVYGTIIKLPIPELEESQTFISWTKDGKDIIGNEMVLDFDKDAVLVAKIETQKNTSVFWHFFWPLISIIIIGLILFILINMRKRKTANLKNVKTDIITIDTKVNGNLVLMENENTKLEE